MNSPNNLTNDNKKDYYIIRAVDNKKISGKQHELEEHMINNYNYKILDWENGEHRLALQEQINGISTWISSLCAVDHFSGMDTTLSLTNYISNTSNTIIYSMENHDDKTKTKRKRKPKKIIDCVLLFRGEMDEYHKDQNDNEVPYIDVIAFCANQILKSKKGGIFFEHFLNSLRGQYTQIELSSSPGAYKFYKSFGFIDENGDKNMKKIISSNSIIHRKSNSYNSNSNSNSMSNGGNTRKSTNKKRKCKSIKTSHNIKN